MARGERVQFGLDHAPDNVDPPDNRCERCKSDTVLTVPSWLGRLCKECEHEAAVEHWQSVLAMVDDESEFIVGYDDTCGMQSKQAWAHDFMMAVWENWMDAEVQSWQHAYEHWQDGVVVWVPVGSIGTIAEIGPRGFMWAVHVYLAAIGSTRLSGKVSSVMPGEWYATAMHDWFARRHYPVKFSATTQDKKTSSDYDYVAEANRTCKKIANDPRGYERAKQREKAWLDARSKALAARGDVTPTRYQPPVITPQQMQSNSEVLEAIAMSKLPVEPARVNEMEDAIEFAINNWTNMQARVLFDGYELKQTGFAILLKHPEHPSGVTVGLTSPADHKLRFVARRGEIREFMHKVAAGMKPSDNPKLPGVMMQAPIPDNVKMSPQLQTLKNLTESTEHFMAVLHDGEADGTA
jgi:hypothetical protein